MKVGTPGGRSGEDEAESPCADVGQAPERPSSVLLIHGRHEAARVALSEYLESLGLQVVRWRDAADRLEVGSPDFGRILRKAFDDQDAIIVLLTADDEVRTLESVTPGGNLSEYDVDRYGFQKYARQNVVFEAGMAEALHPDSVLYVSIGNPVTPSDLLGRDIISFDEPERGRRELMNRLDHLPGFHVTRRDDAWKRAGDFDRILQGPRPLRARRWPLVAYLLVPIAISLLLSWRLSPAHGEWRELPSPPAAAIAHVAVTLVFLILSFARFAGFSSNDGDQLIGAAQRQFMLGWRGLWASWCALYIWLIMLWSGWLKGWMPEVSAWIVADALNMLSGMFFFFLFLVLDRPTVPTEEDRDRARLFERALFRSSALWVVVLVISVLLRLGKVPFASLDAAIPWAGPDLSSLEDEALGAGVVALAVAVSMAYFFGRLDSRYLGVERAMLGPLYLYVALQMSWILFPEDSSLTAAHLWVVLLLKVYLFVAMMAWISNGSMSLFIRALARAPVSRQDARRQGGAP